MSKAFVSEGAPPEEDDFDEPDELQAGQKNYMTPPGFARLQQELNHLLSAERPRVVEIVSWAAGNGDRSENGDYIYGKKRLREIDRRLRYLTKRLESAVVVDPAKQQSLDKVFFGATVTYSKSDGTEHRVMLAGVDEIDLEKGMISWVSPLARALMKAAAGDTVELRTPSGAERITVEKIEYLVN